MRWKYNTIGILGGFGAAAGARCFSMLVAEYQRKGAKSDTDFPRLIVYSKGSKGLDAHGVCDEDRFKDDLHSDVSVLEKYGAEVILIACNTAYLYYDTFTNGIEAVVIDMPQVAIDHCAGNRYGVVCSRTTRDKKLYGEAEYCTDKEQEQVDEIIGRVMAGENNGRDRVKLESIVRALRDRGAQQVLLGCTELPLAGGDIAGVIDPMTLAIQEVLG